MAKLKETPKTHNSDPAEKERKVLFFINRKAYLEKLAAKKAADAALKNVCKTIKSDLGEHGLDQIKDYEKAQTPEGQVELKAKFEATAQAMRFAGMAVNSQTDLFIDLAPLAERAFLMGEEAGLKGETLANPFNEGSAEGQEFARGWHQGQGALFEGIKKKEEAANTDELLKGDDDPFGDDDDQREAAE